MAVTTALRAAGNTHSGLVRDINEDRFHYDPVRGHFIVVDGMGGEAAGELAADIALTRIRERLETGNGTAEHRIREAIANANNEVFRAASKRPEWRGMACVLTVAVIENGDAVIGHVGDTRAYKVRRGRIQKLTRDHSPVGEREDAGELSEQEAMRHPQRNEVYRDVGSEARAASDPEFIDVIRVPFEPDAALLLCSDGLTDSVPSATINGIVTEYAGHAYHIVQALVDAANAAGGKDNVTVVYVEGSRFAEGEDTRDVTRARGGVAADSPATKEASRSIAARWGLRLTIAALGLAIGLGAYATRDRWLPLVLRGEALVSDTRLTVNPGESITSALEAAAVGSEVVVEPGEYRERLVLREGIRVRSRVARGASIRLPAGASESDAAVVASNLANAELSGFRIIGDAATPLGTGVLVRGAHVTLSDLEITGARAAAVEFGAGAGGALLASELHDNPGAAALVRAGATARVAHNAFARNATAARSAGSVVVEAGATVDLRRNVFHGSNAESLVLPGGSRISVGDNWFIPMPQRPAAVPPGRNQRGRQ